MQVIGRCEARCAYKTDGLALSDSRTDTRLGDVVRHVRIQRRDVATVLQDDGFAVAILDAAINDLAVAGGVNRRSTRRCIVNTPMGANRIQDRMTASRIEV